MSLFQPAPQLLKRILDELRLLNSKVARMRVGATNAQDAFQVPPPIRIVTATLASDALTVDPSWGRMVVVTISPESGNSDILSDINGAVNGQLLILRAAAGKTITVDGNAGNFLFTASPDNLTDVVLTDDVRSIALLCFGGTVFHEQWRTNQLGALETDLEIRIPLTNPIIASAATQLEDYIHKKPYNIGHRINRLYARAASNVGGDCTFKLQKNGSDITSATITIPSGARIPTSSTPVAFTEAVLADADVITVVQTTARVDAINMSIYIYGDRDVLGAVV